MALALQDPLRVGTTLGKIQLPAFAPLERSLDDPAVRAWSVMAGARLTGALVVTVDDGVGYIGLLLAGNGVLRFGCREAPDKALISDQQICRLLLRGPLDAAATRVSRVPPATAWRA